MPYAEYLVYLGQAVGWRVRVTSVRRDSMKQAELRRRWEQGLSRFPAAKPGCSVHEHGLAFDMVVETGRPPPHDIDYAKLAELGRVWQSWGGVWGGVWKGKRSDPVHFQGPGPAVLC